MVNSPVMAGVGRQLLRRIFLLSPRRIDLQAQTNIRCLSRTTWCSQKKEEAKESKDVGEDKMTETEGGTAESMGWLQKMLRVRTLDTTRESHSSQLSTKETVYEMQFHSVKPEDMEQYLKQFEIFTQLMHDKSTGASLVGSFTVEIGDQDEAIHIWEYKGGYPVLNRATEIYRTDQDFIQFRVNRNKMLRSRKNQILLAFSFWPEIQPREGPTIYELRSYTLKPGTMIEWANNWANGIQQRAHEEAPVAGYFAQIGELYTVQHLWGYKDLQTRKAQREKAWNQPGWDQCVAYTVPLIRHMQSRILIPTPFSPLQ